jgi:hypothetical protein
VNLDENFTGELYLPIKIIWLHVRRNLPSELNHPTNEELIELCIDSDRMKSFGYGEAARKLHRAVDIHGFPKVKSFLASQIEIA